jgi:hypothetical protein
MTAFTTRSDPAYAKIVVFLDKINQNTIKAAMTQETLSWSLVALKCHGILASK